VGQSFCASLDFYNLFLTGRLVREELFQAPRPPVLQCLPRRMDSGLREGPKALLREVANGELAVANISCWLCTELRHGQRVSAGVDAELSARCSALDFVAFFLKYVWSESQLSISKELKDKSSSQAATPQQSSTPKACGSPQIRREVYADAFPSLGGASSMPSPVWGASKEGEVAKGSKRRINPTQVKKVASTSALPPKPPNPAFDNSAASASSDSNFPPMPGASRKAVMRLEQRAVGPNKDGTNGSGKKGKRRAVLQTQPLTQAPQIATVWGQTTSPPAAAIPAHAERLSSRSGRSGRSGSPPADSDRPELELSVCRKLFGGNGGEDGALVVDTGHDSKAMLTHSSSTKSGDGTSGDGTSGNGTSASTTMQAKSKGESKGKSKGVEKKGNKPSTPTETPTDNPTAFNTDSSDPSTPCARSTPTLNLSAFGQNKSHSFAYGSSAHGSSAHSCASASARVLVIKRRGLLERLAALYASLLLHKCVPSIAVELHLLVRLLTLTVLPEVPESESKDGTADGNVGDDGDAGVDSGSRAAAAAAAADGLALFSTPLFARAAESCYFAACVLHGLLPLLKHVGVQAVRLLSINANAQLMCPPLVRKLRRWLERLNRSTPHLSPPSLLAPCLSSHPLTQQAMAALQRTGYGERVHWCYARGRRRCGGGGSGSQLGRA
jgi:hypothetical protein